jgi:hypothetical protein
MPCQIFSLPTTIGLTGLFSGRPLRQIRERRNFVVDAANRGSFPFQIGVELAKRNPTNKLFILTLLHATLLSRNHDGKPRSFLSSSKEVAIFRWEDATIRAGGPIPD